MTANLWQAYSFLMPLSTTGTSAINMLSFDPTLSRVRISLAATVTTPLSATADLGGEVAGAGWAADHGTVARSTAQAHTGAGSMLLTPDGTGASVARTLPANSPTVQTGQQYTETIWVYSPGGWAASAVIGWIDSGGTELGTSAGTEQTLVAGTWTQLTVTGTAPASAVHASLRVTMSGTPTASNLLYVDDVQLTLSFPAGSTWLVQRSIDLIRWTTVRGGTAVTVDANARALDDYEFVADLDNQYRVQVWSEGNLLWTFTDDITPLLGVTGSDVWLKDLAAPGRNRVVTVASADDITRDARAGLFAIVGAKRPIAVTDLRAGRAYTLTVNTVDADDDTGVDALLDSGNVLFLQAPAGFPLDSGYYAVGASVRSWRDLPPAFSPRRWWSLPLTEAAPPAADVVGSTVTWEQVVATYATWADVGAATWNELADPTDIVIDLA